METVPLLAKIPSPLRQHPLETDVPPASPNYLGTSGQYRDDCEKQAMAMKSRKRRRDAMPPRHGMELIKSFSNGLDQPK
jgi:hypothetical protein